MSPAGCHFNSPFGLVIKPGSIATELNVFVSMLARADDAIE
jgi:hypothetical protein